MRAKQTAVCGWRASAAASCFKHNHLPLPPIPSTTPRPPLFTAALTSTSVVVFASVNGCVCRRQLDVCDNEVVWLIPRSGRQKTERCAQRERECVCVCVRACVCACVRVSTSIFSHTLSHTHTLSLDLSLSPFSLHSLFSLFSPFSETSIRVGAENNAVIVVVLSFRPASRHWK